MAFTISTAHTLPEVLRHKAPDGSYMAAIDVLKGRYPMLEETYWEQANDDTAHEFLRTSTEPAGTLVRYEEGAPYEISISRAIREQLCRIEGNMRVDVRVLEKSQDPAQFYREKQTRYFSGMTKTFHKHLFASASGFGNMGLDPKAIDGLGVRYPVGDAIAIGSEVATTKVVTMGSSAGTVRGSIWMVKHGPDGFFMIHPRTASRTIKISNYGEETVFDASGNPFRAVSSNFAWEFGMGIADDMAVQRLCNIAVAGNNSFFADGTTVQKGEYAIIDMASRLPMGSTEGVALYTSPQIAAGIRKRLNDKTNMNWNLQTVWGRPMLHFMDMPVIEVDTLAPADNLFV